MREIVESVGPEGHTISVSTRVGASGILELRLPLAEEDWFGCLSDEAALTASLGGEIAAQVRQTLTKALLARGYASSWDCLELYASLRGLAKYASRQLDLLDPLSRFVFVVKHLKDRLVPRGSLPLLFPGDAYSTVDALVRSGAALRAAVVSGHSLEELAEQTLAVAKVYPVMRAYMELLAQSFPGVVRVSAIVHRESGALFVTEFGLATFATRDAAWAYLEDRDLGEVLTVLPVTIDGVFGVSVDKDRLAEQRRTGNIRDIPL